MQLRHHHDVLVRIHAGVGFPHVWHKYPFFLALSLKSGTNILELWFFRSIEYISTKLEDQFTEFILEDIKFLFGKVGQFVVLVCRTFHVNLHQRIRLVNFKLSRHVRNFT